MGQTAVNVSRAMEALGWRKTDHPVRLDADSGTKQRAYVWGGESPPTGKRVHRTTNDAADDSIAMPF